MEPSNPSIVELLDEAGKLLCPIIEGDCEIWEMLPVLLIPRWALCKGSIFIIHPLLKYCNVSLESLNLLWTLSLILMVAVSLVIMDLNWSGVGLGVAVRMFCTEVGERGNPQELVVARAILAPSLVTTPTQRASFWLRLRCPGKQLVVCSGDEMCIGMGRGAENEIMAGDLLLDRSAVDIANDPQV